MARTGQAKRALFSYKMLLSLECSSDQTLLNYIPCTGMRCNTITNTRDGPTYKGNNRCWLKHLEAPIFVQAVPIAPSQWQN